MMNIKRAVALALVFLISFAISLVLLFPYKTVLSHILTSNVERYQIALSYEEIEAGAWGAVLKNAVYSLPAANVELGDIKITYNPLSLITKKAALSLDNGFGTLALSHKGSLVEAVGALDVRRIAKLFNKDLNAFLKIQARYDYKAKTGGFTIASDKVEVNTETGLKLSTANLRGTGTLKGNAVEITEITSEGDAKLNLKGLIRVDPVNFMRTSLNLSGAGGFGGLAMNFVISGTLAAPKFALQGGSE